MSDLRNEVNPNLDMFFKAEDARDWTRFWILKLREHGHYARYERHEKYLAVRVRPQSEPQYVLAIYERIIIDCTENNEVVILPGTWIRLNTETHEFTTISEKDYNPNG